MEFRRKRRKPVDIGLIPMIDVLLVLVFFFMATTTFTHKAQINLNLAKANSTNNQEVAQHFLSLNISQDGQYALYSDDQLPVPMESSTLEGLKAALSKQTGAFIEQPFIINADAHANHQSVISAMDVANQLGFHRFSFSIEEKGQNE
jgi:biopolymer transport protein ExbD